VFIVAGVAWRKSDTARCQAANREKMRNGVIALGFRFRIAEAFGEQLAGTLHGVLLFSNMVATVIEQARQRLAGGCQSMPCFTPCARRVTSAALLTSPCASMMAS
jgi:hypothetical protein